MVRRALPAAPTQLIGREADVLAAGRLIAGRARLVTLTGPGGVGKTRLAFALAEAVAPQFTEGPVLVSLAPLRDPGLVLSAVVDCLGLRQSGPRSPRELLHEHLGGRSILLVLDNFEHVMTAAAEVAAMLAAAPELRVIATSRAPLRLRGEHVHRVRPLTDDAAVALFRERATEASADLAAGDEPVLREICRRLDRLPLAIELAAARTRVFAPDALLDHLGRPLHLLMGGARDLPKRQRTLGDTIAWSYDLLGGVEQRAFRALAVFAGGWTLGAAATVCAMDETTSLEVHDRLLDQSLVTCETRAREPRFAMLETVRAFAEERLDLAGERTAAQARHVAYCLDLAERAEPELTGPDQLAWLDRLHTERDNLLTALGWSTAAPDAVTALRLAAALKFFWHLRGSMAEGAEWLRRTLDAAPSADQQLRGRALWGLGVLSTFLGDIATAQPAFEESLALARDANDARGLARSLSWLGQLAWFAGDLARARDLLRQALPVARDAADEWGLADACGALGWVEVMRGDAAAAQAALRECLVVAQSAGDRQGLRFGLGGHGLLALMQGEVAAADAAASECLHVLEEVGGAYFQSGMLAIRAATACLRDDLATAETLADQAVALGRESGVPMALVFALEQAAAVEAAREQPAAARELLDEALEIARSGSPVQIARVLLDVADVALSAGDAATARDLVDEALAAGRRSDDHSSQRRAVHTLGRIALRLDEPAEAIPRLRDALRLGAQAGDPCRVVEVLEDLAAASFDAGEATRATRLQASAWAVRERLGWAPRGAIAAKDSLVASLGTRLGADALAVAWAEGAALSMDQAVQYASRGRGGRRRPRAGWASLTPTEARVTRLVAEGLTNRQIGERLFVSPRTVQTHLEHVFAKVGVSTRAELAAMAARNLRHSADVPS